MKNLAILVKMQLKEQLNFKRLEVENVKLFHVLLSILGTLLKFAMVTVLCGAFLIVSRTLGLFSVGTLPVPDSVISIVFSVMLLASVFSCMIGLTRSMYYARDNAVLLTLPCLPIQVYLSKLIIFFIFEIKRNFSFIVPLFLAYYIIRSYAWWTYPWMLLCILFVSLFTVSIGALLSIPAMWVANFFRQHRSLQVGGICAIVAAVIAAIFWGISLIPENIDLLATWKTTYWQIQDFLEGYKENLAPVYRMTQLLLGETESLVVSFPLGRTFGRFGLLVGASAFLIFLGLVIVRPLFYKMASTPFEYLKRQVKARPNRVRSRRFTSVYNEFLISVKSTDRLMSNVGIIVSVPMLIFLLNKIFLAMNTREMGDHMVVAFNVLIILLIVLNANCYASSIFSRDGRSSYLIKTQPSKYPILILSKLLPNTVFVCLSILASFFVMLLTMPLALGDLLMLIISIGMTYLAHMLYCAELDLMNPQIELYSTVGSSESNPNETRATLTAFVISFLVTGIIFFLLTENNDIGVYLKYIVVSAIALIYRTYIFFAKLRLYYKEK